MFKIRTEMENEKRRAIEQIIERHKEEIAVINENHNIALSEAKKKQWVNSKLYYNIIIFFIYFKFIIINFFI